MAQEKILNGPGMSDLFDSLRLGVHVRFTTEERGTFEAVVMMVERRDTQEEWNIAGVIFPTAPIAEAFEGTYDSKRRQGTMEITAVS